MKKAVCTFLFFLYTGMVCSAQTLPFRTYSSEKGLSEAVVSDLAQDDKGYIWVATSYGLNRFDGFQFENFYAEDGLFSNKIFSLLKDRSNRMWVGTGSGVNVIKGDSVRTVSALDPLKLHTILDIYQDKNGEYWFGTDGQGVWHLDQHKELTQYSTVNGLGNDRVRAIIEDADGTLWFGTGGGLCQLKDGSFRTFGLAEGLPDIKIQDLALGPNQDTLWIATRGGLSRFSDGTFTTFTTKEGLVSNHIQSISGDGQGGLWLGTEEGVSHFFNESFSNITTARGLSNNKVYATLFDREHNIWFGTYGNGITLFLGEQFKNYTKEQGLPKDLVTSVTQDQQGIHWITTFGGGLTKYEKGEFTTFDESDGLINNNAYTSYVNRRGDLLIGTEWGLSLYDGTKFTNFDENDLPFHRIRAITASSERLGEYWLGTYGDGLLRYWDGEFTSFSEGNELTNNRILAVEEGPDGGIWIASYGGVTRFKGGKFVNYSVKEGLPNNGVLDILITGDEIWVSTFEGVARYDKQNDSFVAITAEDGLPDEVCYFIIRDENDFFWIGTNKGVVRLDYEAYRIGDSQEEKSKAFKLITDQQGLVANEMNAGAGYKDHDGRLWFGSVGGLTIYDPKLADDNPVPPIIHIESVQMSGETAESTRDITVKSNSRNITFQYVGISFKAPDQIRYEYRLKGSGEEWQRTMQRSVRYSSLFPGDYTFQVRAQSSDGLWSTEMASLSFTVLAPFWLQWWFLVLMLLLLAGVIYFVYNFYRMRKMVEIERMRVRIASDLHDDVGSSLTEIALQSDFLQTTDASDELKESVRNIGTQSRRIVSSLDDIVWSIDARNDTLGDLTDRMQDYINNILPDREVMYHFDNLDMDEKLTVTMKENLYLIFKEAINNIAKHSNATKVEVKLKTNGDFFHLIIHDNGTKISQKRKTGHGLRNMDMRAQRINASVNFKNADGFTVHVEGRHE